MLTGDRSRRLRIGLAILVGVISAMAAFSAWESRPNQSMSSGTAFGSKSAALQRVNSLPCKDLYLSSGEPHVPYQALAIDCTTPGMEFSLRYYFGKPIISKILPDWDNSLTGRSLIYGEDWFVIAPADLIRSLELSENFIGPTSRFPPSQQFSNQELGRAYCSNSIYFYIEQLAVERHVGEEKVVKSDQFHNLEAKFPGVQDFVYDYLRDQPEDRLATFADGDELANRDFISTIDEEIKLFCHQSTY
jgi:hypothetical protein